MKSTATALNPERCRVGANPIIWSNDDFSDLAGDVPLETILSEMRAAGFAGSELGHAYPRSTAALGEALGRHGLALVSGWHSTYFATRALADELVSFRQHLQLLGSLGASVAIVAECSYCIHGNPTAPLGVGSAPTPRLSEDEWRRLFEGMKAAAREAALVGMKVVYHHHMGTVIQAEEDLERLLQAVPELWLLLDPGHLAFAGIDSLGVAKRHLRRIAHVHLKSVRAEVAERSRKEGWSFYRAVKSGVFTIPGEGCVDFVGVFALLASVDYQGWLVVEAEEDPTLVPALPKARRARDYVRAKTGL